MKVRKQHIFGGFIVACVALAGCGGGGGGSSVPAVSVAQNGGNPGTVSGGGTGGSGNVATAPTIGPVTNQTVTSYNQTAMQGASYVGPATFGSLGIDVLMQMQNAPGLVKYGQDVSNPSSASYRRFLTPQQIADTYGVSQANYNAAASYFRSNGLAVDGWPQREMLHVTGVQPALERALGVKFGIYQRGGTQFIAPRSAPVLSAKLAVAGFGNVVAVTGAHTFVMPAPRIGDNIVTGYSPQQVAVGVDYAGAYRAGYTGSGITIGIIGTGPINEGYASQGFGPGDAETLGAYYHTPVAPITVHAALNSTVFPSPVPVPSGTACGTNFTISFYCNYSQGLQTPPPPSPSCTGSLPACNPEDVEAQLDTEMISTLAPGSNVWFYLAYNPAECFQPGLYQPGQACQYGGTAQPYIGLPESDDEIQQAIADNTVDALSLSYGEGELDAIGLYFDQTGAGWGPVEFATLAAEGISVFVSSGDDGSTACRRDFGPSGPNVNSLCVDYPGDDVNVTGVGGTTIPLNSAGQLTGPISAWGFQTTSGGTAGGFAGSTGGLSTVFPVPSWQTGTGITGSFRNAPDMANIADPETGVTLVLNSGPKLGGQSVVGEGGTSLAAPATAAMWGLVLQACKATAGCATASGPHPWRLGNAAPLFYKIYNNPSTYASSIYDVQYGNNGAPGVPVPYPTGAPQPNINGYYATPGYDLVTGVGNPFARSLIKAIVGV